MSANQQRLNEVVEWAASSKVEGSMIRGVKVLGRISRNGREYTPEAVAKAAPLYEGVRVNIDHNIRKDADAPRSYTARIGRLVNVAVVEGDLRADLQVNPEHPHGKQLLWDAEHSPASCGLSHNVAGSVVRRDGKVIVESIDEVYSVDVVADPATTDSLYESLDRQHKGHTMLEKKTFREVIEAAFGDKAKRLFEEDAAMQAAAAVPTAAAPGADSIKAAFRDAVMQAFDDESLDTKATLKRIGEILKAYDKLSAKADEVGAQAQAALDSAGATESIESLRKKLAAAQLREACMKLAIVKGLPADDQTVAVLSAMPTTELRESLATRLASAGANNQQGARHEKPVSKAAGTEPAGVTFNESMDAKAVAAALAG